MTNMRMSDSLPQLQGDSQGYKKASLCLSWTSTTFSVPLTPHISQHMSPQAKDESLSDADYMAMQPNDLRWGFLHLGVLAINHAISASDDSKLAEHVKASIQINRSSKEAKNSIALAAGVAGVMLAVTPIGPPRYDISRDNKGRKRKWNSSKRQKKTEGSESSAVLSEEPVELTATDAEESDGDSEGSEISESGSPPSDSTSSSYAVAPNTTESRQVQTDL